MATANRAKATQRRTIESSPEGPPATSTQMKNGTMTILTAVRRLGRFQFSLMRAVYGSHRPVRCHASSEPSPSSPPSSSYQSSAAGREARSSATRSRP
ncbi:hypothetical protein ACFFX0_29165 [Citricoccus parietis]|uniref:Uncharacterized protein n=1 Tax=Citricoccus parietis TaxID=592307 RepID=A0ABV5G7U8_9MICC